MTDLATRPHVPLQVITPSEVRGSIRRAKKSLEDAAKEIVWQIEMEAWRTLGYSSWTSMREVEYGGAAFMVPSKSRPEIVARIKAIEIGRTARGDAKHLTDQEIADTVGVSRSRVQDDLNGNHKKSPLGQNVEVGDLDDDVIDAEIVEDDESFDAPKATDPAPAEPVIAITCPTCAGTGKVTR